MLSRDEIAASHRGHRERGRTTDSRFGTLSMTTFRNDPMTSPYTAKISAIRTFTSPSWSTPRRESMIGAAETVQCRGRANPDWAIGRHSLPSTVVGRHGARCDE